MPLYEAADLDGASWWSKTVNVTLPMLSPVILFNLVLLLGLPVEVQLVVKGLVVIAAVTAYTSRRRA